MASNARGLFVVIEGMDGAGTTTQTKLLTDALNAGRRPAVQTREPSDGPIGVLLRQMLAMRIVRPGPDGALPMTRETLALLFAADRLDHVAVDIDPVLARGDVVISDRYDYSSLAYQGDVEGDQVDYQWVLDINARARRPDLTVFLRIGVEDSIKRLDARAKRDLYETHDKLERLALRYDEVMEMARARGEHVLTLDATDSIESIQAAILAAVHALSA